MASLAHRALATCVLPPGWRRSDARYWSDLRSHTELVRDVREILTQVGDILRRYDYDERASFVSGLAQRAPTDEDLWQTVAGPEFWGGSGAVWEIGPFYFSDPSIAMPAGDYRRFKTLMVELADVLASHGVSSRASDIAEVFKRDPTASH